MPNYFKASSRYKKLTLVLRSFLTLRKRNKNPNLPAKDNHKYDPKRLILRIIEWNAQTSEILANVPLLHTVLDTILPI